MREIFKGTVTKPTLVAYLRQVLVVQDLFQLTLAVTVHRGLHKLGQDLPTQLLQLSQRYLKGRKLLI